MAALLLNILILTSPTSTGRPDSVSITHEMRLAPATQVIRASGVGYPPRHLRGPQARLMARRAAETRALRNLARKLGLGPRAVIRGFRYVEEVRRPDGSCRVTVEYRRY